MHGYTSSKDAYQRRMRLIEGQTRGIARMIDEDVYCIDVLTQIEAVRSALKAVSLGLLEDHLGHCVTHAIQHGGTEADEKIDEAIAAIRRMVK